MSERTEGRECRPQANCMSKRSEGRESMLQTTGMSERSESMLREATA